MTKKFKRDLRYLESNPNSWQSKFGIKIASLNFIAIPLIFYELQRELRISYSDIIFIGYIFHRKQNNEWPYISLAKMSRTYKVSQNTLNKNVSKLKTLGYLKTKPRRGENRKGKGRNYYDLSGLIEKVENIIENNLQKYYQTSSWDDKDYEIFAHSRNIERKEDLPAKQTLYKPENIIKRIR